MSFGKMNSFAEIRTIESVKDEDGFTSEQERTIAHIRVYREGRHGSERWSNLAAFSDATDLFRFRCVPGLRITTDCFLVCGGDVFDIESVEDVKGRGMYTEVLARKVVSSVS